MVPVRRMSPRRDSPTELFQNIRRRKFCRSLHLLDKPRKWDDVANIDQYAGRAIDAVLDAMRGQLQV